MFDPWLNTKLNEHFILEGSCLFGLDEMTKKNALQRIPTLSEQWTPSIVSVFPRIFRDVILLYSTYI